MLRLISLTPGRIAGPAARHRRPCLQLGDIERPDCGEGIRGAQVDAVFVTFGSVLRYLVVEAMGGSDDPLRMD